MIRYSPVKLSHDLKMETLASLSVSDEMLKA